MLESSGSRKRTSSSIKGNYCACKDCCGECVIPNNLYTEPKEDAWRKCGPCYRSENKPQRISQIKRDSSGLNRKLLKSFGKVRPDKNEEEVIHKNYWERIIKDVSNDIKNELDRKPYEYCEHGQVTTEIPRKLKVRPEYKIYLENKTSIPPFGDYFNKIKKEDPLLYKFIDKLVTDKPEVKIKTSNCQIRSMLDESTRIKTFLFTYIRMIMDGNFAGAKRPETLNRIYKYFNNLNKKGPSDLLRLKKLRDLKLEKRSNETPMRILARALRTLHHLFKRSLWRRNRFNNQMMIKFDIDDEDLRLAEYKGAVAFIEGHKMEGNTMKRLRSDYRSSKTEQEYIDALKNALTKKRHVDDWIKKSEIEKEEQKASIKLEIASKNYGEQLCKLNREEDTLMRNLLVNKARDQLFADLFSIHLKKRIEPIRDICCYITEDHKISRRNLFDASALLQQISPSMYFEKIQGKHGKTLLESYTHLEHSSVRNDGSAYNKEKLK